MNPEPCFQHPGGQGFWIARMLVSLGVPASLCGCFGGETGAVLVPLVEREGVPAEPSSPISAVHRSPKRSPVVSTCSR